MAFSEGVHGQLAVRFQMLLPHLDERQRRLLLAAEARLLGHGGVRAVARVSGVSETTVRRGVFELEAGEAPPPAGRTRRPGGGRKRAEEVDPGLVSALMALVEPDERGDPMSPLRWTTKSLRNLADELTRQGHPISAMTVGRLLKDSGFSLQAQAKTLEGEQHPDRDAQFRYINEQVKQHQADDEPVISVDTKKKEMIGQLPNPGRQWRPKGDPVRVDDHSFFSGPTGEAAIPYGIYDLSADAGWVNVGTDHDTSVFAVASIRRWWQARGRHAYPQATRLLITADAGGSNGYRYRVWKAELAKLVSETGLAITVCHFPPGTSKWNKIEHRLFSHITMNWRGRPLTSYDVVVQSIAATRTRSGLRVDAELDTGRYPLGIAISKAQMKSLPIDYHDTHGTWNYTVRPDADGALGEGTVRNTDHYHAARRRVLDLLSEPALTGMSREELAALTGRITPELSSLREERLHRKRGGPRRHGAGDNKRPVLSPADRVLVSVIYLRHVCSQNLLAEMLGLCQRTIGPSIKEVRRLLQENGISVTPTTLCFSNSKEIEDFVRTEAPVSARGQLTHRLADPSLTGMDRTKLADLIDQLSVRQAALIERRRHQQRGGPRQPGTRGGVFRQKITDAERLLAAVLYQRKLGTRQILADAFGVSLGTLNNALADAQPVLHEAGITLPPAPTRFTTGAELLASVSSNTPAS
ncbi:ISAzo13 family transposase [Streptomyces johnsoniae]|uniref:ISAzo13 family transposase n=1 Tax=Streptomyces johnsoniae TaxID=3075532 RepID=A0ABU2S2N7_9ACTN|nr:ISAzo13 family transposase [Streptomyces sp. DSM 41886]MDT0442684.1 ISAzo13 family transposase [Streptomyces sp. DSM 41886]